MKHRILLIVTSLLFFTGYAQQFPIQSQYQFNYSSINPASVGENSYYSARLSMRNQWVGFTENPISLQLMTVTKGIGKSGLGVTVFNDKTGGAFNKSGLSLSYSHKVQFSGSELFLGLSAGGAKINFDATAAGESFSDDVVKEAVFGVYYKVKGFKIGMSIPGLLSDNIDITASNDNRIEQHLYTMLAYEKQVSDMITVQPSLLIKTVKNYNQVDANLNIKLKDIIWLGTSYRKDFGATMYAGLDLGRILSVYSYDLSTNETQGYSGGSHEFTLGYDFLPEESLEEVEVIVDKDQDNDGVNDEVDLCPNIPGAAKANGCPDFDKDGIPDKYDLCPHLFGIDKIKGCPDLSSEEKGILSSVLENLEFRMSSDDIKSSSYRSLTELAKLLHTNPEMILNITGHASAEGDSDYNMGLSARRAKKVQQFFIERGISSNRLIIDYHGENKPLNRNQTESERAQNRRVEFEIKFHNYDDKIVDEMLEKYKRDLNTLFNGDVPEDYSFDNSSDSIYKNIDPEAIVSFITTYDSLLLNEYSENDDIEEEKSNEISDYQVSVEKDKQENEHTEEYLLVVKVFEDVVNAINYSVGEDAQYIYLDGKYYVYVFSSLYREDVEIYQETYDKESWIKAPKKQ